MKYLYERYPPPGLEHTRHFLYGLVATLGTLDVVNGQACHHHIEAGIGEGQIAHITIVYLNSIGYPLDLSIRQGCLSTVFPLVNL